MKRKLNRFFTKYFRIGFYPVALRHSVEFARSYFGYQKINAIEIGVLKGGNSLNILNKLNIKKLFLIDNYQEEYEDYNKEDYIIYEQEAEKLLEPYEDKIVWIKKSSDDAFNEVPMVDFIYIDGNHNYHQVKKDMNNYWERVKVGGILAGHDITSYKGVAQAFVEFCYENKLKPNITRTDWWVIKE